MATVKRRATKRKTPVRTDALRNRQRLLESAVESILEAGGEPSRDAIAKRAGVGIATLYRHFPDQQSLFHATARHVLERSISAGETALDSAPDGVAALRQYMHTALDNGIGVVNMIHPLLERRDWPDLLARADALMKALVKRAVRDGPLRSDLAARDIVFALIRFSRPLAVGLPRSEEAALAHRHLDVYVDGLRRTRSR